MENLFGAIRSPDIDEYTRNEIRLFIERKLDEHVKIRGQIARDLCRLGSDAWQDECAYRKLREKYIRGHQSKKKLAILELEHKANCEETNHE